MDQYSQARCQGAYMRAVTSALPGVLLSRVPILSRHCEDRTVCLRFWPINPCDPTRLSVLIQTCFLGISIPGGHWKEKPRCCAQHGRRRGCLLEKVAWASCLLLCALAGSQSVPLLQLCV